MIVLVFLGLFLAGCGSTSSFEGTLEEINENSIVVNCSDEMNKGKKGDIIDIGYLCPVQITDKTILSETNGDILSILDFPNSSSVRIVLTKPVNIKKDHSRNFVAKEIILLQR
jgi:hypothetical protein